ncbi:KPN_02809 family neutral zinc metallopeptidase [Sediminibacterium sp.]|uniref:KPN_02809 family neutral zinc metallopeptidase n=1 Tax=Sediminibacterium sp. TaxID=1917865 RepID=UPI003F709D8C
MRWMGNRESNNVEDRRGGGSGLIAGGGIGTIIIGLLYILLGGDPAVVVNQVIQQTPQVSTKTTSAEEEKLASFTKVVLAYTEDVWDSIYNERGEIYEAPKLVLFTQQTQSGCGFASDASGPFYCPADKKVYIDLSFFKELSERFNAPGEFAMAYVIAHEVGHHIQQLNGTAAAVQQMKSKLSEKEYNQLSVKLELQADFLAGVWAHHANRLRNILEQGDIEAALNAANAIGDDRLQQQQQGYIVPDAFTHGTSKQRMYWFKKGFETGDPFKGNTFAQNQAE